ncbi:MAG: DUF4880 domain-containing protein [Nitrospira sp. CR2.1]|nr:DUF4880 domain-containing protein [Nitrospira sp. CR2.1]
MTVPFVYRHETLLTGMEEDRISQEALHWLIVLHDRAEEREVREKFDAWIAQSESHRTAWIDAQRTWMLIGNTVPIYTDRWVEGPPASRQSGVLPPRTSLGEQPVDDPSVRKAVEAGSRAGHRRRQAIVAACAVVALCLLVALPSVRLVWQADYRTGVGKTSPITLADGTLVHLGAESAMSVFYDGRMRRVTLLRGEAFFKVTPDPNRPFLVAVDEWTTTVRGTAFNVALEEHGASVTVEEGRVVVRARDDAASTEQALEPGDWVRMQRQRGIVASGHADTSQVGMWRDGRLIVKSRPVPEVIAQLRRYHKGLILVTDRRLDDRLVSGVYDLQHPLDALRAVVEPHSAVVRQVTPFLLVVSAS